jgi:hypothetical protein
LSKLIAYRKEWKTQIEEFLEDNSRVMPNKKDTILIMGQHAAKRHLLCSKQESFFSFLTSRQGLPTLLIFKVSSTFSRSIIPGLLINIDFLLGVAFFMICDKVVAHATGLSGKFCRTPCALLRVHAGVSSLILFYLWKNKKVLPR